MQCVRSAGLLIGLILGAKISHLGRFEFKFESHIVHDPRVKKDSTLILWTMFIVGFAKAFYTDRCQEMLDSERQEMALGDDTYLSPFPSRQCS